jgi:hypothetical protein
VSAILETCRDAGRRAPTVGAAEFDVQFGAGHQICDLTIPKMPPPGSADHGETLHLPSADSSRRCMLVPDVWRLFRVGKEWR